MVTTLEVEVRRRQRDDGDAGRRHGLGDRPLTGHRLHPEADAVARRDGVLEPGARHERGQIGQAVDPGVERLVGVQVDADGVIGGDLEQHLGGGPRTSWLEMRAPSDEIGSRRQCIDEEVPLVGPVRPSHRPAAQRDDLHVDHLGDPPPHVGEGHDAAQPVVERRVHVRAHGGEAVGRHPSRRPLRPLGRLRHAQRRAGSHHRVDGAEQVTGLVGQTLGQERLVQVGVGLDGCRAEDVPA